METSSQSTTTNKKTVSNTPHRIETSSQSTTTNKKLSLTRHTEWKQAESGAARASQVQPRSCTFTSLSRSYFCPLCLYLYVSLSAQYNLRMSWSYWRVRWCVHFQEGLRFHTARSPDLRSTRVTLHAESYPSSVGAHRCALTGNRCLRFWVSTSHLRLAAAAYTGRWLVVEVT